MEKEKKEKQENEKDKKGIITIITKKNTNLQECFFKWHLQSMGLRCKEAFKVNDGGGGKQLSISRLFFFFHFSSQKDDPACPQPILVLRSQAHLQKKLTTQKEEYNWKEGI